MVQLEYHQDIWSVLPKSLSEQLCRFAGDIKPPMGDDKFRTAIRSATQMYSDHICVAVRDHITRKKAEIEAAAITNDQTDVDRAKEIADHQMTRRLGRRLEPDKLQHLLQQAVTCFGAGE